MDIDRERYPYKMKELCERTGLDRQTIHFYIQQGLVPEGAKTSPNMAYYGAEHLERLSLVRELAEDRFLPLKAIRALIEGRAESFTPQQRTLLVGVGERLLPTLEASSLQGDRIDARQLCAEHGVDPTDLLDLAAHGLLPSYEEETGGATLAGSDVWMVELWGQLRDAGFSRELGFEVSDLTVHQEAVRAIFQHETKFLTPRMEQLRPAQVAALVERGLPLINLFLAQYHMSLARRFFRAVGTSAATKTEQDEHADL